MNTLVRLFFLLSILLVGISSIEARIPSKQILNGTVNQPTRGPLKASFNLPATSRKVFVDDVKIENTLPPAGMYGMIRNDALMKILKTFALSIGAETNTYTQTPDQSGSTDSVSYDFSQFSYNINLDAISVSSPAAGQIQLTFKSFVFDIGFNYHICAKSWPNPCENGQIDCYTVANSGVEMDITFILSTSGTDVSLTVSNVKIVSNGQDIEIDVYCTDTFCLIPVDDIANGVAQAFVPTVQTAIQTIANSEAQKLIDTISTLVAFPQEGLELNMAGGFALFPANAPNLIIYGLGAFIPLSSPHNPPFSPTLSPPDSVFQSPNGQLEIVYTDYSLLTAFWAEDIIGSFNRTVTPADVPAKSPIQLNTDNSFFTSSVPGLKSLPHMNITVTTTLATLPTIQTTSSGLVGSIPLLCHFTLANSTYSHDGFVLEIAVGFLATVTTTMPSANTIELTPKLSKFTAVATQISTSVGPVTVTMWDAFLAFALNSLSPQPPSETLTVPAQFAASGAFDTLGSGYGSFGTASFSYAANVPSVPCSGGGVVCSEDNTCCNWGGQWGCCTAAGASCCSQGCCPSGYGCCSDNGLYCCPNGSSCCGGDCC